MNVNEFLAAGLPLGGARPSLFRVLLDTPAGVPNIGPRLNFTCRAASIPGSKMEKIDLGYFGRKVPFAGNRTFENWEITVYNDEDFAVRHAIELWLNSINSHQGNLRAAALANNAAYRTSAVVTQLAKTGTQIRTYKMVGMFPIDLEAIALDWDTVNQVEAFKVTFAYAYWEPSAPGTTGTFAV